MSHAHNEDAGNADGPSEVSMHLAYAEACIVLLESLMHVLIEKQLVSKTELLNAVESAMDTKKAMEDAHWHETIAPLAAGVLAQLGNSLRALPDRPVV
ncbi:MAG: hypothetical protein JSR66_17000 [Proteobacteria bacterium]|nr:hypothetical protein [Pseudomonadota bacterium]